MARTDRFRPRDESELKHLYTADPDGSEVTVWVDQWFTRRKRFHVITRSDGEAIFRSRWMTDIIEWLSGEGWERYRIVTASGSVMTVAVITEKQQGT